jgi:hypothetical protein
MLPVCELCQWHNHSMNEQPAGIGDGWRVLRLLGEGGEGVVYLIEDKATSAGAVSSKPADL